MILEILSVSALFQTHTPFDFLFHSFSQQASFGVTVCQKSFKKSVSRLFQKSIRHSRRRLFFTNMSFWQRSRGWRCSITVQRMKYTSGEGYQTAHRCSLSRQLSRGGGRGVGCAIATHPGPATGAQQGGGCAMLGIKQTAQSNSLIFIYSTV